MRFPYAVSEYGPVFKVADYAASARANVKKNEVFVVTFNKEIKYILRRNITPGTNNFSSSFAKRAANKGHFI